MPLLEVTRTRHINAYIRLLDTTATQLDQYAAFLHATADEVIEQALAYIFSKDRDFQEFLKSSEAQSVTPTLRARKPSPNDSPEQSPKKPASRAANGSTSVDSVAGTRS